MTKETTKLASFAGTTLRAGSVAALAGVAAFALAALPKESDAAGQRLQTVTAANSDACATRGVHLVNASGADVSCPADSSQGQVQTRAKAAAYVHGAGY